MNKESFAKAADLAMDDRIKPYIDKKMSPLEVRSHDLEMNLKTSETLFTQLREKQQFLLLVFRAENHDFYAFSELEDISKIQNELSLDAVKITNNIKDRLIQERKDRFIFKYFMLEDVQHVRYYPDIYSPEEVLETLIRGDKELASDMIRLGGLSSLVPWLISILESERNINVLNRITDTISAFAAYQFYP
jgi:hypothetical protein